MIKVLFVCLGNICRSPLAEGLFQQKIMARGLEKYFFVDSSGTGNYHIGELPDARTRSNASRNGLELTSRARQFGKQDFENFDYIIPMDSSNRRNIRMHSEMFDEKIMLMRDFDHVERSADVPDPYFGGESGFQNVYEILDRSTENFLDWLTDKHGLKS